MSESYEGQQISDQHQYLWNYFQLHASQRLTTFKFYITISTIISTGYVATIGASVITILAILLGLILSLVSFIFWKLDSRNKQLIKNAEEALKYLESLPDFSNSIPTNKNVASVLKIFTYEEEQTNRMRKNKSFWPWRNVYSYSKCFNTVFAIFGILGFSGTVYAIAIFFIR